MILTWSTCAKPAQTSKAINTKKNITNNVISNCSASFEIGANIGSII